MNLIYIQKKGFHFKSLLSVFLLFIVTGFAGNTYAQNIANRLKDISIGTDSLTLVNQMGEPSLKESVTRWFYGGDQVVISNDKIIDIRLMERSRKLSIKIKKDADSKDDSTTPVSYLRIGMSVDEAITQAGMPNLNFQGNDWYYTKRHRVELNQGKIEKIDLHIKASLETLDWIRLNFSDGSLLLMNITIAFVMFGVALGIKLSSFRELAKNPKPILVGVISQFILLPALTFCLVLIIKPTASVAMGMILVSACPGGNVSNFISSMAKGNVALSISLTAISTLTAIFMTPANFAFWGKLYSETSGLVIPFSIDPWEMLKTVLLLLGIPIVLGLLFAKKLPKVTEKIKNPIKYISIIIFVGYIVAALASNIGYFMKFIHLIILIVLIHNAVAFFGGYGFASLFKLPKADRRTVSIETGIQNSGLGLVLIFNPNLFNGLGGMAFIAAWWGIWHIIAGMSLASVWGRNKK